MPDFLSVFHPCFIRGSFFRFQLPPHQFGQILMGMGHLPSLDSPSALLGVLSVVS